MKTLSLMLYYKFKENFLPTKLDSSPCLVLNADYQPLSYFPLSLWGWQDVIKAVFLERVNIVAEYNLKVNASNFSINLPSVISLKKYISLSKKIPFTRFNLFLRDRFRCQYCNKRFKASELTFDHVISRAKGGKSSWENVVSACFKCNNKKGSLNYSEANMKLVRTPKKPSFHELRETGKLFPPNYLHHTWSDFLYWDTVLESK